MTHEAVLFDVDDTLCRYRRTGDELLAAAFERTGVDPFITREEYHDRYPEFVDDSDSVTDLRAQCFAAIAAEKGHDPAVGRRIAAVYADYDAPAKPSPEPFEAALSELSVRPERAVHVGNSLRSDVAGARAAGVRTVWLAEKADPSTVPDPEPDHAISTLSELPSVVGRR